MRVREGGTAIIAEAIKVILVEESLQGK